MITPKMTHAKNNSLVTFATLAAAVLILTVVLVTLHNIRPDERGDNNNRDSPFDPRRRRHISFTRQNFEDKYKSEKDVFISIKTSEKFHRDRLEIILKTWYKLAEKETWFFTDSEDEYLKRRTSGKLINTRCPSSHNRSALCCKMAAEIRTFLGSKKSWFCHFDDDNYVNVPALMRTLSGFPADEEWYLGKTSVPSPLQVVDRSEVRKRKVAFWFATGGAGLCLSRPLVERMAALERGLEATGEDIRLPDDVTLGFIIEHKLGVPLTQVKQFHSHLEPLKLIPSSQIREQISFSYSRTDDGETNVIQLKERNEEDPTKFIAIHCHLFPGSIGECG